MSWKPYYGLPQYVLGLGQSQMQTPSDWVTVAMQIGWVSLVELGVLAAAGVPSFWVSYSSCP